MPGNRDREREPDLFDALRFSESESDEPTPNSEVDPAKPKASLTPETKLIPAKPPVVSLQEEEPEPESDELVVELPEIFERPHTESIDKYDSTDVITRHRLEEGPPPAPPARQGLSKRAAFGIAVLTQLLTIGLVVGAAFAFPKRTAGLLRSAAERLDPVPPDPEIVRAQTEEAARQLRLELIELEDIAVAKGDRDAFAELSRYAETLPETDPNFQAAEAGRQRVEHFWSSDPLGEPEPLDARALYAVEAESQLPQSVIIQVLRDSRQPVENRRRAARLLAGSTNPAAKQALYNTIRDDPDLSVVQAAFKSFRGLTGYPETSAFDARSLELWWARNEAEALNRSSPLETGENAVNIGPAEP